MSISKAPSYSNHCPPQSGPLKHQIPSKGASVFLPYAVPKPRTMMIVSCYTSFAFSAVLCSNWLFQIASSAISIFDYYFMRHLLLIPFIDTSDIDLLYVLLKVVMNLLFIHWVLLFKFVFFCLLDLLRDIHFGFSRNVIQLLLVFEMLIEGFLLQIFARV